jgi:hypothetical protein
MIVRIVRRDTPAAAETALTRAPFSSHTDEEKDAPFGLPVSLDTSSSQTHNQRDKEYHQKNKEENLGDACGCPGNPAKT